MVPDPETAAANQRQPSSDHTPGQLNGDLYLIHDMVTKGQHTITNVINGDEQDAIKLLEDLDVEISRHQQFCTSSPETTSSIIVDQTLPGGTENNRLQDLSLVMRRWKSQPFDALPWHGAELLSTTAREGTHNEKRAGTDDKGLNEGGGTVDADEEAWSNKASAGSEAEDTEEKLAGATTT
jgi:hypothetical protein